MRFVTIDAYSTMGFRRKRFPSTLSFLQRFFRPYLKMTLSLYCAFSRVCLRFFCFIVNGLTSVSMSVIRIARIVWSSGCGQFMWFINAQSISSPKFSQPCSRSFSSMIFKMTARRQKTLQRLVLQNLQKSWRFLSRDLMRSSKQNGGKRFALIFLRPRKHYAGMAS